MAIDLDDTASGNSSFVVACRFVPYDQWLITHLNAEWRVRELKLWLIAKCIPTTVNSSVRPSTPTQRSGRARPASPITFAPDPRDRPMSPITFAPPRSPNSRDDSDDDEEVRHVHMGVGYGQGEDAAFLEDDVWLGGEGGEEGAARSYGKTLPGTGRTGALSHSRGLSAAALPDDEPFDPLAPYAQFLLLRFSTGQILEDDLPVSWYDIQSNELLELHRANVVVRLPRSRIQDYIQPYWEGWVKRLMVVDPVDIRPGDGYHGKERTQEDVEWERKERSRKVKFEWQERWVVIREGTLSLYKDRVAGTGCQTVLLSDLTQIRGSEHLHKTVPAIGNQRIVCARFRHSPPSRAPTEVSTIERLQTTDSLLPPSLTTTITTISADAPPKKPTKSKLKMNLKSSSSIRKLGSTVSEASLKSNMFAVSSWKLDNKSKNKIKKPPRDPARKDKGKARDQDPEVTGIGVDPTSVLDITHLPPEEPCNPCNDDLEEDAVMSSPIFARTSSSDEMTDDESEGGRAERDHRGTWRGKGGYGYRFGGRYVDGGSDLGSRTGDTGNESESAAGDEGDTSWTEIGTVEDLGDAYALPGDVDVGVHQVETTDHSDFVAKKPSAKRAHAHRRRTKATDAFEGEWITMNIIADDTAYHSLLRILHRHFPDPIVSTFVKPPDPPTPFPSPASPTGNFPKFDFIPREDRDSADKSDHHVGSVESSTSSSWESVPPSPKTERRDSLTQLADGLRSLGAVPYPEWRIDRMVRAQKAGMGDVGKAMGWMLWGGGFPDDYDVPRPDRSSLKSSSTQSRRSWRARRRRLGTPKRSRSISSSRSSSRRSQTSTVTPTPSVLVPPETDPYETDVSGALSSGESSLAFGDSGSEGETSEVEWRGWTADLQRQARIRQLHAEAARAQQERLTSSEDPEIRPLPLMSAAGWQQSPYRYSTIMPTDIPHSQAQAQRLFQEGRRAMEPSAVVTSSPTSTTPPPPSYSPDTSEWLSSSVARSLSSPSSSESLSVRQRHHALTFSPVESPSATTPLSAFPTSHPFRDIIAKNPDVDSGLRRGTHHSSHDVWGQDHPPRMPNVSNMLEAMAASGSGSTSVQGGTPTPRTTGFPAVPLGLYPAERSLRHDRSLLQPGWDPPSDRAVVSSSGGSYPVPRRSSSVDVIKLSSTYHSPGSSPRNKGKAREGVAPLPQQPEAEDDRASRDSESLQRGRGHRPVLSVTTFATHPYAATEESVSPTSQRAPQSPTRLATRRSILRRVRSGSSLRGGEDVMSWSGHFESFIPSRKKKNPARSGK